AEYADPIQDIAGGVAVLSGRPRATRHGRSGAYVSVDQVVWRPDANVERNLRVFGLIMKNVSGRVIEDRFVQLGLVRTGTFRRRPSDTVAFVINDQTLSRLALQNISKARASAGESGDVPRHQIMTELAYGIMITASIRVSPNIHVIVHPDQLADPFRAQAIGNVLAFGLKFTVDVP